jgi:hypothetical protein
MSGPSDDTLGKIEESQAALRASIEKAKALASESERRLRRHREEMDEPPPPPPA